MTNADFQPQPGVPLALEPGVTLVLAPNPSPMTHLGTNTYLIGGDSLAVIDPGPKSDAHLAALIAAIDGRPVSHIFVTHAHLDHSPLAPPLSAATGAPVLAFGTAFAGRSAVMMQLAQAGFAGGGEGIDAGFVPDQVFADGDSVVGQGWDITALHTPGHIGNHLCFAWGERLFSGDHVMGWATSLVSPPDGDMADFMRSCARLSTASARVYYPGHGAPVYDPAGRLAALISHRSGRTAQIISALQSAHGPWTVPALTAAIYLDVPPALLPAAARNVFAHLIALQSEGVVSAAPTLSFDACFTFNRNEN